MMTLGKSFSDSEVLANVSQLGWFTMPTKDSPLQFLELGIEQIVDQDGSWMKTMSKLILTLRIVFMIRLFFQTFCEKIFIFFSMPFLVEFVFPE